MPSKKNAVEKTVTPKPVPKAVKTPGKPVPATKKSVPASKKTASKAIRKPAPTEAKPVALKASEPKMESLLMVQGAKFLKSPFFADIKKDESLGKQKYSNKPTVASRPKINGAIDSRSLVEILSQQLEFENRAYFEGCEGQICVKCNANYVDQKYYVDKSLGYCTDCAALLGLGQSKEGVFSDAQMELMRRSMEKSIENAKDIDENNIESALGEMDSLDLEEAIFAAENDAAEFNA